MPRRELMTQRQYARHRGISHTAVAKAIRDGRIHTVRGRIDPVAADKSWAANTDEAKPRNSVTGDPKMKRGAGPSKPHGGGTPPGDGAGDDIETSGGGSVAASYAAARALRERFQARLAKLDYDQRVGKLVSTDEVRVATFNVARSARNQLMGLPDRLSPIFASMTSARDVRALFETEIRRVCEEIADASGEGAASR